MIPIKAPGRALLHPGPMEASGPSSLLPKERGAYAQLAIALLAGLCLGSPGLRSLAQTLLTVLAFLAGEPLRLLLAGKERGRAWARLGLLASAGGALGWMAWHGAPVGALRALAIPGALATLLVLCLIQGREHTAGGEWIAAWALASAAHPVALLAGARPRAALALTFALGALFSTGMTVARAHLRAWGPIQALLPTLLYGLLLLLGTRAGWWPFREGLAYLPMALAAAWLQWRPAASLKRLGWTLATASGLGAVLAILGLR